MESWKKKTYLLGGIIGLLAGILASFIIVQQAEKKQTAPALTANDGVKLSLGLLTFMRLISDVSNKD